MFQRHIKPDDFFTSEKCLLHFVPQVGKTLSHKEPDTPNTADRKSELFWTLLAQLLAQLFAQLSALSLSLLNTHEGEETSTYTHNWITVMQPSSEIIRTDYILYSL